MSIGDTPEFGKIVLRCGRCSAAKTMPFLDTGGDAAPEVELRCSCGAAMKIKTVVGSPERARRLAR